MKCSVSFFLAISSKWSRLMKQDIKGFTSRDEFCLPWVKNRLCESKHPCLVEFWILRAYDKAHTWEDVQYIFVEWIIVTWTMSEWMTNKSIQNFKVSFKIISPWAQFWNLWDFESILQILSCCSVTMSDSLWPHGL